MGFFSRFSRGNEPLNRIEAFSDGVFAIVVTLLVLDLHVPDLHFGANNPTELWRQLQNGGFLPNLLSWFISFVIVCKFWVNHHHVIGLARRANYTLMWLNALFLLGQSFVPFPTALMGRYPGNPLAVAIFGLVMALNTLLFMLLHHYVLTRLIKPERAAQQVTNVIPKSFGGVACYLLAAGLAYESVWLAFAIYLLTPLLFIVPPEREAPQAETQRY